MLGRNSMPTDNFADLLTQQIRLKKTPLVVGIDPRLAQLPASIRDAALHGSAEVTAAEKYEIFSKGIIDVVAPLVPAIKPQMAFFEELGPSGMLALANIITFAQDKGLMVILDGKRNDIGSTAQAYANAYLGKRPKSPWGADALTVNPWMGFDTLVPFTQTAEKNAAGFYVLLKTSNPGSAELQEQNTDRGPLFHQLAVHIEQLATKTCGSCGYGIAGAVVGATYPDQLAKLRSMMPHTLFLVPGFGAQGGSAEDVAAAFDANGLGAVINSSRGIIFAYETPEFESTAKSNWQHAIEQATHKAIAQIANATPASQLR